MNNPTKPQLCCPCHALNSSGFRPRLHNRIYPSPSASRHVTDTALSRRPQTQDSIRKLTSKGLSLATASKAVALLYEFYPEARWIAAEAWQGSLPLRKAFFASFFPSVFHQYEKDLWTAGHELTHKDPHRWKILPFLPIREKHPQAPFWLRAQRPTPAGPTITTCAWWQARFLKRPTDESTPLTQPHVARQLDLTVPDWRRNCHNAPKIFTSAVSYLELQGLTPQNAAAHALRYVLRSVEAIYQGQDWPHGAQLPYLLVSPTHHLEHPSPEYVDFDSQPIKHIMTHLAQPRNRRQSAVPPPPRERKGPVAA